MKSRYDECVWTKRLGLALWTLGALGRSAEFLRGQGEGLFTSLALANFKIRFAIIVDFTRQEEIEGIVAQGFPIRKFHDVLRNKLKWGNG